MNLPGIIRIDLTQKGEQVYPVPGAPNRLWLAKFAVFGGVLKTNPLGVVLAVRVGDPTNDQTPWGLTDGMMNSFSGEFSKLYITVLTNAGAAAEMFLNTGTGVSAGHCNTDGLSPYVGSGASAGGGGGGSVVAWI